jgi:cytochrome b
MNQSNPIQQTAKATRVWDLPLRAFHWSLLITVVGLFVTAKIGGGAMKWHFYCGYLALALLVFRVVWGFMGSRYARFASFPPNPVAAWHMFRGEHKHTLGHNPMGALSVYGLLVSLGFQAVSGLFSNDDIAAEGPLAVKVSRALSDQITGLHKINEKIIIALVLTHFAAIMYYRFVKNNNLITAMVTGDQANAVGEPAQDDGSLRVRALSVLALCGAAVWLIVNKL